MKLKTRTQQGSDPFGQAKPMNVAITKSIFMSDLRLVIYAGKMLIFLSTRILLSSSGSDPGW